MRSAPNMRRPARHGKYTSADVTVAGHWAVVRYTAALTMTPKAKGGKPMAENIKGNHIPPCGRRVHHARTAAGGFASRIFAHVSRSVTVRLKTSPPAAAESAASFTK